MRRAVTTHVSHQFHSNCHISGVAKLLHCPGYHAPRNVFHTFVVRTAPFRTAPTARAVGRHDLANILSTVGLSWRSINRQQRALLELGGGVRG
jgi:hypothetical protein